MQSVNTPTHEKGHILDLVPSCGLPVVNFEIHHSAFFDNMPVTFETVFTKTTAKSRVSTWSCQTIKSTNALQFLEIFN